MGSGSTTVAPETVLVPLLSPLLPLSELVRLLVEEREPKDERLELDDLEPDDDRLELEDELLPPDFFNNLGLNDLSSLKTAKTS